MKNKFTKRVLSLVLVLMMVLTTAVVSMGSASAASNGEVEYSVTVRNAYGDGECIFGDLLVNINGTEGSTGWQNLGTPSYVNDEKFTAPYVGEITSIDACVDSNVNNGFYPNYFDITTMGTTTRIYGGEWLDNGETVNFGVDDKVYSIDIFTSIDEKAGTDLSVYVTLFDEDGDHSKAINASDLSFCSNAFERGDVTTVYIHTPDEFDDLKEIRFELFNGPTIGSGWLLEKVYVDQVSGEGDLHCEKLVCQWGDEGEPITVKF